MPNYHKSRNRNRNKNKNRNNNNNSNNSNTDSNRQNRLNQNNSQQHLKDKEKCNVNEVESVEITTKATTQLPVSAESVSVVNVAIDETNERDDVTASNTIAHIGNEVQLLSKEPKPTIGTSGTVSFEHTKGNEAIVGYGQVKNEDPHENMGNNKSKEVEHIPMPSPVNEEAISNTSDILLESNLQKQPVEGKIIVHRVLYEEENEANNSIASNLGEQSNTQNSIDPPRKATVHRIHIDLEEDDEKPCDDECKEKITNRSQVEICEVNEDLITSDLPIVQSPIVTEVESESEELTKIESPDDAMKTSDHIFQYDDNLDTRQRSKQKKLAIQNHFLPHFLNPRYLDSITEENSDLSDYSDKVKAPLQSLKEPLKTKTLNFSNFMQETSTPLIVETRITETPGADESCSILECSQAVKPEAAETIFINSASSSITDLLDYENMETNSRTVHDADTVNISSKSQSEETPANKKTPTTTTTTMSDCIDDKQIVQTTENMIMRSPSPGNIENASANTNDLVATSVVLSSSEHMPTNPITERNENFENSVALISSSSNGCETLNSILSVDHKTKQQILFENEMNNVRALLISENSLNTNGNRSSDVLQNNNNSNSITTTLTKDSPPTPTLSLTTASESIAKLNSDPVPDRDSDSHLHENNCSAGKPINADTTKPNKSVTDAQSSISDVNGAACTLRQHGNASTNFYFTYPEKLRILCAEKLESLPYGHAVLEELAKISQNIGEVKAVTSIRQTSASSKDVKMPYPLPTMPHIKDLQLHLQSRKEGTNSLPLSKPEEKLHSQTWTGIPTNSDPKVLVCISPSQRSYMERHVEQQPDDLLSAHQKFIERRGYYEYTKNEIEAMEEEKRAEKDVLQMAAHMKKLRKSLTPTPPPIPPPPVPIKSMETSVKALNSMNQAITGDMKKATATNSRSSADSVNKEENIKHLLEILNNTNETKQKQILDVMSSLPENSSRQTNYKVDGNVNGMPGTPQTNANKHSQQRDHFNASDRYRGDSSSNMEIDFKLNPTYSETLPLNFESKSYSKMETSSSYEAKKRIENGKIVCDTSESKYDKRIETDSNNNNKKSNNNSNNERESSDSNFSKSEQNKTKTQTQTTDATNKVKEPIPPYGVEIMSDTKLNKISEITKETKNSTHSVALDWDYEKKMKSDAATDQEHRKTNVENEAQNLCKEFRQNAKTSDLLDRLNTKTSATTNEIKDQVTSQHTLSTSSSFTSDHEKLLKEFDELSKRLHNELETNTWQKRQRELSSSMFDLSALQMKQKQHFEEFKRRRHEHMKELENEIEKSIKSRQLKFAEKLQNGQVHNVPIRIEADEMKKDSSTFTDEKKGNNHEPGRVYQIPIKIENTQKDRQMHRSESMFNLGEEQHKGIHRPYANHMNQMDSNGNNWSKQRQDFGFSENISKPFAREVEICYQRQSPRVIRAPRLTDAPNDSSLENNASTSHHSSKRFSAPMFTERQQPSHHASCYSMIERDPNPTYISTTTRRGVSPAPTQVSASQPDVSQRRDSLPKSFHDQKLKHLSDKENALRAEFEQLQNERRRLLEEIQIGESSSHPSSFNTMHETYRSMQKLPTLTENEVFRQQMAEEWLSKVAEREKRRLQKVVKISKISDNSETFNKSTSTLTSTGQASDMGSEFLKRVKERRSKLAIPADSDWESGAESQPINQNQTSEADDVSSVKFIEGKAEAKPSQLPKHLREFAKFSTAQQDQLDGNDHKEHFEEEEQSSEITENSTSKALKKSWMTKTVKISRSSRDNGQEIPDAVSNRKDAAQASAMGFDTLPPNTAEHLCSKPFPPSIDELFPQSSFRDRILEQFNNYWQHFHATTNNI